MAMSREERIARKYGHTKQERLQVQNGTPKASQMREGVPILRSTNNGVTEYIKHNNVLWQSNFTSDGNEYVGKDLEVRGNTALRNNLTVKGTLHISSLTDATFILEADTDNTPETDNPKIEMRQDGNGVNGYLGITGAVDSLYTDSLANTVYLESKNNNAAKSNIQFVTGGDLDADSDGTVRMTVTATGKIGIGTITPDTTLEVVGSFAANGPSSTFVTMSSGDTSPDVSTGNIFKSHSDGVTIDQFDGGVCGQIITIISGGATVYDVTSSELKGGTTNITTAAGDVTMWVCESATVWHLLSWMDLSIDLSSGGF